MVAVLHLTGPIALGPEPDNTCAEMWVIGDQITFERPAGTHEITTIPGWVIPGLVDAHCHIGLNEHGASEPAEIEEQAVTDRDTGVLLVRDAGVASDTRWVDDRADLPRIIRAGRHLARPKRYLRNYAFEIEPDDLVSYVIAQAQAGDGWVKLIGDWIERAVGDLTPCWPARVLKEAIEAAHQHGARVTAHCFATNSLQPLVDAGIDCVEHATGLNAHLIDQFAAKQIAIVPTLINIATFPDIAAMAVRFPWYAKHMLALHERRYETIGNAYEAGVPIYAGTDAGGTIRHGRIAEEVQELHRAGMPTAQALSAACWGARTWLGHPALSEGAPADFVLYDEDPRVHLGQLAHPRGTVLRGHHRPTTAKTHVT